MLILTITNLNAKKYILNTRAKLKKPNNKKRLNKTKTIRCNEMLNL